MYKATPCISNHEVRSVNTQDHNTLPPTPIISGLPPSNIEKIPQQPTSSLPLSLIMNRNVEADILLKEKYFTPTKGNGDCAFHAIFGVNIENIFTCIDVQAKRTAFVEWLKNGATHGPGIEILIQRCIEDLIDEKELPIGFHSHSYPHIMEARQSNQAGHDINITQDILQEYYQWVEGVGHWMLRGEIQLIAYAFNKTIICLSDGQTPQEYNPGKTDPVFIKFNGTHYERQEDPLPSSIRSAKVIDTSPPSSVNLKLQNKSKDMKVLYRMLCILIKEEKGRKSTEDALKKIASFAGGADGITFKEDDSRCIRNRYGREGTNIEIAGFINFEQLHRVFIILDSGIIAPPQNIKADLNTLKSKILFILHKELQQHSAELPPLLEDVECISFKDTPYPGDKKHLQTIYQYARENYYHVAIKRIKEQQSFFTEEMLTKDDLYFVGRKIVFIGELCHEIEKDLRKTDEKTKTHFKSLIDIFSKLNRYRNIFVHPPASFVGEFEENPAQLNSDIKIPINALYQALQDTDISTKITKACKGISLPTQKQIQSKKISASSGVNSKIIEESLKEAEEYQSLLRICRSKDSKNLSKKEQEALSPINGEPPVDLLFLIADNLNAPIAQINALKILNAKTLFEAYIQADIKFKEQFEKTMANIQEFDIASKEKCTEALEKIATLEIKSKRKIKFTKYENILSDLKKLSAAYEKNDKESIAKLKEEHQEKLQAQTDHKEARRKQNQQYQQAYAALATELSGLNPNTFIDDQEEILKILDHIAPVIKEDIWKPNKDIYSRFVGVLASAYNAHSIRDPKVLAERVRKESADNTAYLLKAISEEMRYSLTVDDRVKDPEKRQAIKEYVVTLVGQYMRELSDTASLKEQLISHMAYEAGSHMQQLRSKGLAHESLRFDPIQFEEDFRKIIIPAVNDLYSIHLINQHNKAPSKKINALHLLAQAYIRLCFYDEAIQILKEAILITEKDKDAIDKEKLEEVGLNTSNTFVIDGAEIFFGIESYTFKLQCRLAQAYYVKGDYDRAYETAHNITSVVTNVTFAEDTFLDTLASMWNIIGNVLLFRKEYIKSAESFLTAYNLAVTKDHFLPALLHCQQEALRRGQTFIIPEDISNNVNISSVNRFSLDLARCYHLADQKNFSEIKEIIERSKILLEEKSHEFKQLGDRYQLSHIKIIGIEIIYAVETDPKLKTLVDIEKILRDKLDQLRPQLKKAREVGVTLSYFSEAYSRVAAKQGSVDVAIELFTTAKDRLDEATCILSDTDIALTRAKKEFSANCYNYQGSTLENNYEESLQLLNLALTLGDNPYILASLGYMHLQQAENAATQESDYTKAAPFYRASFPPLKRALMIFKEKKELTPQEKFEYQVVIQNIGRCYEGYGRYCFYNKRLRKCKELLEWAIKLYNHYLSFTEKKGVEETIKYRNHCIQFLQNIQ